MFGFAGSNPIFGVKHREDDGILGFVHKSGGLSTFTGFSLYFPVFLRIHSLVWTFVTIVTTF